MPLDRAGEQRVAILARSYSKIVAAVLAPSIFGTTIGFLFYYYLTKVDYPTPGEGNTHAGWPKIPAAAARAVGITSRARRRRLVAVAPRPRRGSSARHARLVRARRARAAGHCRASDARRRALVPPRVPADVGVRRLEAAIRAVGTGSSRAVGQATPRRDPRGCESRSDAAAAEEVDADRPRAASSRRSTPNAGPPSTGWARRPRSSNN